MKNFCYSCGIPLTGEGEQQIRGNYCQYCADETGNLYPRELVQKGIADWLQQFTPQDQSADFMKRADYYMKAMPAWAEKDGV